MEPYPSRRPLAGRYGGPSSTSSSASPGGPDPYGRYSVASSGVTSPIIVNGRGGSPISSPSATLVGSSSRLSSSSSASSGPGSNGSTIAKRPYEGQKSGGTSATAAGGGGGLSLRDLSSPTLTSSNRLYPGHHNITTTPNPYADLCTCSTHNSPPMVSNSSTNLESSKSNVSELKHQMREMSNLSATSNYTASSNRSTSTSSMSSTSGLRSGSVSGGGTGPAGLLKKQDSSAFSIAELPSPSESGGEMEGGNFPLVTHPGSELMEDEGDQGSLTSPNLVHRINPGLSLTQANFARMQSSYSSSHQERKESSSSSVTKTLGEQSVTSVSESQSSQSQQKSSVVSAGQLSYHGDHGQAVFTGIKKEASSSESHEKSSSSSQRISSSNGAVTASHHSSSHSSSKKSSRSMTMTASAGGLASGYISPGLPHLLTSDQFNQCFNMRLSIEELSNHFNHFDDLESLTRDSNPKQVENVLVKHCSALNNTVEEWKKPGSNAESLCQWITKVNILMNRAWENPVFGHQIGNTLCDILRQSGGLDVLIDNCVAEHQELQFQSAKLLQQCVVTSNRGYVVEKGLDKLVTVAKLFTENMRDVEKARVGTGILEHLFKHSETTCSDVIAMGGLDRVVNLCKSTDTLVLSHCASALANVAIFGGTESQEAMVQRKVPSWLFHLAFETDDNVKYYACLAIAVLVANKEIEAAVQKSGTLELIEPFVQSHTPYEFAITSATHSHGQSSSWLKRLIPVLLSNREEARNLAAFHFCMEAEIKKQQGNDKLLQEIGCVESLRKVASGPNGIASKYAAQTLRLIGEDVPHKLSQQVPTWSVEDVKEWIKQIGFPVYAESFQESRVDGDLLLQLSEDMLREDIGMRNGILRRRFMRELTSLKKRADYSSCDATNLNGFLSNLGNEYSVYTYDMLNAGIDRDTLMSINEEQLLCECGIKNKIHRIKIQQGVKVERGEFSSITDEGSTIDKTLDVFISYRRSNGSQLASLLKVHLGIRNLSVFLDVDRLEAGKFDNNLLQSIRSARNFVLVLTPGALDRCKGDDEQRDWIHKEVACALNSKCNIIPVFDNFVMPDPQELPSTMKAVTSYNGVKWIHDYQDACVDKIDRFIRGDAAITSSTYGMMDRFLSGASSISGASSSVGYNRQNTYQRTISNDSTKAGSTSSDEAHTFSEGLLRD